MKQAELENGTLERQIHIEASPAIVYEVISSPEHIPRWWSDEADFEPRPGGSGALVFGSVQGGDGTPVGLTVVEAVPGERFAFRWSHAPGEEATSNNSLLVTFTLAPEGTGTRLSLVEEGFREQGWEAAKLEEMYRDHEGGWDTCMGWLVSYIATLPTR